MLVEMKDIIMEFGPVRAIDNLNFTARTGEILGLLGENGAGKSTLMNILAGTFPPVSGEIHIDGCRVNIDNPRQAAKRGIRFIHQELSLCRDLRVYENMFLAEELTHGALLINKSAMVRRANEVFARMGVDIDPMTPVEDLTAAQQQFVEIGKALLFQCNLIIMDEPTTALSAHEVDRLFDIMRQLKAEGVGFIYISHKMPELFAICDVYFVMRDGGSVAQGKFSDIDEQQITELMIGRQLAHDEFTDKIYYGRGEVAMSAQNLSGKFFRDVSFDLHKGEIIAITGLHGSGRDMLADALFGVTAFTGGLEVMGTPVPCGCTTIDQMKRGIAMVPRSRKERGIYNDLSIYDNTSMAFFNTKFKGLLINHKTERERFERQKTNLRIKTDQPKNPITSLSGGNQQKVILGRWLETDAQILLFDNPTHGIDVGSKFEIYHLILRLAQDGKAIIIFSSEFSEIINVADNCIVMYKGAVNATLDREEITEKNIMYYSTGANLEGEKDG